MYIDENVPNADLARPAPVALGAEERWAKDRDTGLGQPGTTWLAQMWNDFIGNVRQLLDATGIVRVNGAGGDTNLIDAIHQVAHAGDFYDDQGAADAYDLVPLGVSVGAPALLDGLEARFRPANANTGASTVDVNGLGAVALVDEAGVALVGGELATSRDAVIRYHDSGGHFRLAGYTSAPPALPFQGDSAESASNVEATVEGACEIAFVVPGTGNWRIEIEVGAYGQVETDVVTGNTALVEAFIEEDVDAGGFAPVGRKGEIFLARPGAGDIDFRGQAIGTFERSNPTPGSTYTYHLTPVLTPGGGGPGTAVLAGAADKPHFIRGRMYQIA